MAKTSEVPEWSGGKLTNGEFLNYSNAIVHVAQGFDPEIIPVKDKLEDLEDINVRLVDFINETKKSYDTEKIANLDARRDTIFVALWNYVEQLAKLDGSKQIDRVAKYLQAVLSPYKGVYRRSLTQETEALKGLKFDIDKNEDAQDCCVALGIDAVKTELFAVNAELDAIYTTRSDEERSKGAEKAGDTTASLRKTAAGLVEDIIGIVNAMNKLKPGAETQRAASDLAVTVQHYKTIAAQSSKRKSDDSGDSEPAAE